MPSRLSTPVLTVDPAKIHEVDTRNAESLHGMWMVFSRCADYMEEGRRLENLSWRLWNRETFCVEPTTPRKFQRRARHDSKDVPALSTSVESAASDEAERIESHIRSPARGVECKPAIVGEDSALSISRGKEKHITSLRLEKMVYNIKEKKSLEPLQSLPTPPPQPTVDITPRPSSPTPAPVPQQQEQPQPQPPSQPTVRPQQSSESCSTTALDGAESDHPVAAASDTSVSSAGLVKSSSIVKGFSPGISSSYRSHSKLSSSPVPTKTTLPAKPSPLKKKGGMFTLGGSSGDDESSFEDRMVAKVQRSSLSEGLHSQLAPSKKVASFSRIVESRTIKPIRESSDDEDAILTDDEEISESAIEDDDDSSDWEDSVTESGRSSVDEKELFQRVDSRANLVSRRSLLTMMMHQPERMPGPVAVKSGVAGSRSTPALQRSRITSPNQQESAVGSADDDDGNLTMRGPDVPRSKPIIVKSMPAHPPAHSPRTTRRNMLATELTESLRRHLLWERQQKTTAQAAFKRRHTSHDMANLQEYPGPQEGSKGAQLKQGQQPAGPAKDKETSKNNSWNHYFENGPWEYHIKGW
ncbi:hypothetical protein AJ80_04824 [Polytolypa hystricis UAMH7299]|uniref:Uncharacterized protein n=1 Tax=Polytolypa hystricis (strain UAMH7299) TaxID=1447883 RepID=A0A2B7Y8F0_POLH7|nr:hypothetical protein AJ80_04824 [Polytolypa hystricis UAMH7299]